MENITVEDTVRHIKTGNQLNVTEWFIIGKVYGYKWSEMLSNWYLFTFMPIRVKDIRRLKDKC